MAAFSDVHCLAMADIFISYKREDRETAEALANFLARKNYSVWWDTSLRAGESFSDVIEREIDAARKVVVLWSKASVASYWVRAEAARGLQQGKLVAASLDACNLPLPFTQIHTVPLSRIPQDFQSLLGPLSAPAIATENALTAATKSKAKRLDLRALLFRRQTVVAAGVAVCALLGYFVVQAMQPPTPEWRIARSTFVGEPIPLEWTYPKSVPKPADPGNAAPPIVFEIEYDLESGFASADKKFFYTEGSQRPVQHINGSRYWRLRAVDNRDKRPISGWSRPMRITQYDSSYRRIEATGAAIIAVSDVDFDDVFKWTDKNNQPHGLDIALAQAVVDQLSARIGWHIEARFVSVPWDDLLGQPGLGQADMILAAISKREDRQKKYSLDFSETYLCTTQALLFRTGESIGPVGQMIANRRVGYQALSTSANLVAELEKRFHLAKQGFDRPEKLIYAILNREIDFAIVDAPFAANAQRTTRQREANRLEFKLFAASDFPDSVPAAERYDAYSIGIRGGDELLPVVNAIINKFKSDGTLAKLYSAAIQDFERAKGSGQPESTRVFFRDNAWECGR